MDYLEIAREVISRRKSQTDRLEDILAGNAIELFISPDESLFIVSDEEDVRKLGKERGQVYTLEEVRSVLRITDPSIIREIHHWKRTFNATVTRTQEQAP